MAECTVALYVSTTVPERFGHLTCFSPTSLVMRLCSEKCTLSHLASVWGWYADDLRWAIPNLLYKHSTTSPINSPPLSVRIADRTETRDIISSKSTAAIASVVL